MQDKNTCNDCDDEVLVSGKTLMCAEHCCNDACHSGP